MGFLEEKREEGHEYSWYITGNNPMHGIGKPLESMPPFNNKTLKKKNIFLLHATMERLYCIGKCKF